MSDLQGAGSHPRRTRAGYAVGACRDQAAANGAVWSGTIVLRNAKGQPVQISRSFKGTEREAETALATWVIELQHASADDTRGVTVAELLEAWLDHIEPHRKPSTMDRYRRKIKGRIIPASPMATINT